MVERERYVRFFEMRVGSEGVVGAGWGLSSDPSGYNFLECIITKPSVLTRRYEGQTLRIIYAHNLFLAKIGKDTLNSFKSNGLDKLVSWASEATGEALSKELVTEFLNKQSDPEDTINATHTPIHGVTFDRDAPRKKMPKDLEDAF